MSMSIISCLSITLEFFTWVISRFLQTTNLQTTTNMMMIKRACHTMPTVIVYWDLSQMIILPLFLTSSSNDNGRLEQVEVAAVEPPGRLETLSQCTSLRRSPPPSLLLFLYLCSPPSSLLLCNWTCICIYLQSSLSSPFSVFWFVCELWFLAP